MMSYSFDHNISMDSGKTTTLCWIMAKPRPGSPGYIYIYGSIRVKGTYNDHPLTANRQTQIQCDDTLVLCLSSCKHWPGFRRCTSPWFSSRSCRLWNWLLEPMLVFVNLRAAMNSPYFCEFSHSVFLGSEGACSHALQDPKTAIQRFTEEIAKKKIRRLLRSCTPIVALLGSWLGSCLLKLARLFSLKILKHSKIETWQRPTRQLTPRLKNKSKTCANGSL